MKLAKSAVVLIQFVHMQVIFNRFKHRDPQLEVEKCMNLLSDSH